MNLLKKIWNSLGPFKIKSIYFGLILIVTAIFETLGIGIIYQIIKIIIEPDFINNNYYLSSLSQAGRHLHSENFPALYQESYYLFLKSF